ncbi:MAG: hypothetical protein GY900_06135, partial [Actinomycetia bacterium]|nr:hypothetical protein [Actinomycetes bacterium]
RELLESQYGAIGSLNRKTHAEQYYFPAVEDAPTWGESALWSMEEMSVARNIMAWTGRSIEKSRREAFDEEELEEEAARIEANLSDLLYGIIGDDARMAIQYAPTLKEAQRQSTWIRKQQQRIAAREHEPWFQAMVGGVAGFVLDPTNLVPGMALAKTGTMAMRTAMAARAMSKAGHKTQLAARVGGWSALGTTEELVRNIPRTQVDALYSTDQYIMDAVFAGAFGGALPMLAPTFRVAGRGIGATAGLVADAGHALGADVAFRTAANMTRRASKAHPERAADVPPPPVTVGDKVRAAKAAATRTVAERLRSFRRYKADAPIREGVAAGAGDAIDEANDTFLRTLIDDLRQVVADPDNPAPRVYGTVDEELAAIKNTGRPDEAPTPHTPTGDVEADKIANVRHAARTAQTAARQTHERAARLIDESNMSPEAKAKAHMVNDINRNNNMRAIDDGLSNVGLRPVRTRLNNATHTDVLAPLVGNLRKAMNSATSVLEKTVGEIGMNVPQDLRRRLNATLSRALMVGGASRDGVDASFKDAFVRHFKNKDHKSRQEFVRQTGTEFQRNFGELVEEIMDEVTDPDMMDGLLTELELIRDAVSAELHILEQFAKNPFEDMTAIPTEWAMTFNDFGNSVNTAELSRQFVESKLQSALKHQYWTLTNSLSSRLIRSEVPGAQWFALNILETPSGFGGKIDRSMTASILSETLNNIHSLPVLEAWEAALSARALRLGWGVGKRIRNYSASAKTHEDIDAFSREVLEYVNSKKFGHVSREVAPEVREFGDTLLDTYSGLHDLQVGWVDGINAANKRQHYIHQQWDDGAILDLLATPGGRKGLEDLFQQGYTNAGLTPADAAVVAKAMVDQKIAVSNKTRVGTGVIGDEQVAGNMPDLLWTLQAAAKRGDTDESTVWRIVEMLNDNGADGRPGYAKSRVDIDYNASVLIDGKTVSVMDLLDRDLPATFLRYTKEATARRAISESSGKQLNSDEAMNRMLIAVNRQGSELGRPVNTRDMQNALMMMMGRQYDGQLPLDLRRARDAVSLAGMGGLGESQLAEFGLAINRGTAGVLGLVQTARSRAGRRKGLRG